jgi:hypothetical protein
VNASAKATMKAVEKPERECDCEPDFEGKISSLANE